MLGALKRHLDKPWGLIAAAPGSFGTTKTLIVLVSGGSVELQEVVYYFGLGALVLVTGVLAAYGVAAALVATLGGDKIWRPQGPANGQASADLGGPFEIH